MKVNKGNAESFTGMALHRSAEYTGWPKMSMCTPAKFEWTLSSQRAIHLLVKNSILHQIVYFLSRNTYSKQSYYKKNQKPKNKKSFPISKCSGFSQRLSIALTRPLVVITFSQVAFAFKRRAGREQKLFLT